MLQLPTAAPICVTVPAYPNNKSAPLRIARNTGAVSGSSLPRRMQILKIDIGFGTILLAIAHPLFFSPLVAMNVHVASPKPDSISPKAQLSIGPNGLYSDSVPVTAVKIMLVAKGAMLPAQFATVHF